MQQTQTPGQMRNSSVELFRIIATFLVLIVHFNGWFVGMPDKFGDFTFPNLSQDLIEALSCTCVNCFLVITGWYGMTFKWKHLWTIYSIIVWIYVPCYILRSTLEHNFSIIHLLWNFVAIGQESYYVQCYLMLLFLSPVLNSFIQKYGRKILPYSLAFWCIEIALDWILQNKCLGFAHGYMLTHFVLMYLLGQTAFLYKEEIHRIFTPLRCVAAYITGMLIIAGLHLIIPAQICFAYTNPLNILMSFSLFFIFEHRTFYNKAINWISSSTLAVYVLHSTTPPLNWLWDWDNFALTNYTYPIYLALMALTIIGVFIVSVLYDKIRLLFMPQIGNIVCNWISNKTSKYALPK